MNRLQHFVCERAHHAGPPRKPNPRAEPSVWTKHRDHWPHNVAVAPNLNNNNEQTRGHFNEVTMTNSSYSSNHNSTSEGYSTQGFLLDTKVSEQSINVSSDEARGPICESADTCADDNDDVTTGSSCAKSEENDEEDSFDMNGLPMPRISSSTIPVVVEVTPRSGSFSSSSDDPLFKGVCLYSGSMTSTQRNEIEYKPEQQGKDNASTKVRLSRLMAGIFSRIQIPLKK